MGYELSIVAQSRSEAVVEILVAKQDMTMNAFLDLDNDTLQEQLKARKVMKRESLYFYGVLFVGAFCFFAFGIGSLLGFFLFFAFLAAFRTATVWYQWNFLIRFQLTCPFCKRPLAEKYNLLISPTHNCPHCGKRALAPIKQLTEFEKSIGR